MVGQDTSGERGFTSRLETVFELTDCVIWEVSLDDMSTEYLGPVERVTGLSIDECRDPMTFATRAVHPDDQADVGESFEALLAGEIERIDSEYRTHPENGSVRWLRTQAFLESDEDEHSSALVGMSIDITPLKSQEARLQEFTSVVSHDLRSPLSVAKGRLQLAKEEAESEHLDAASDALDRIEQLIEELLVLAQSGETVGDREQVNLGDLAERCWRNLRTAEASLVVKTDRILRADESRLRQLLENLFRNAVEHGGKSVTVTVGSLDEGFYVEDDGIGIPPAQRKTLLDRTSTVMDRTSGLGLQIAVQIVDGHGWEIQAVEGTTGGARFEITGVKARR